ncbi:MAG: TetR/AcrR family transcriptional regulator [Deferribacterales bacterium]
MNITSDDARVRLLEAALDLFTEKGYAAASVSEIVSRAGVTKPMLYYYFKNKEGIYTELMDQAFTDFKILLKKYESVEKDVYIQINNMFRDIMNLHAAKLKHARLIYAMVYGPPQGAPFIDFEEYHAIMAEMLNRMIKKGVDNGELEDVVTEDFTTILLSVLFFCMDTQIIKCSCMLGIEDVSRITGKLFDKIIIKRGEG